MEAIIAGVANGLLGLISLVLVAVLATLAGWGGLQRAVHRRDRSRRSSSAANKE